MITIIIVSQMLIMINRDSRINRRKINTHHNMNGKMMNRSRNMNSNLGLEGNREGRKLGGNHK